MGVLIMSGIKFNPQKHHRKSIRLQGYDYSQPGAYFVTVVAFERKYLFGDIVNGEMKLNQFGMIVRHAWHDLPKHYQHVEPGIFCIMPNHVHAIIVLIDDGRGGSSKITEASPKSLKTRPYEINKRHPLPEIIRAFKSFSAKRINKLRGTTGVPVWQRNYYERIIRNSREMDNISRYIESNPLTWMNNNEIPHNPV
jgi:putative transposase